MTWPVIALPLSTCEHHQCHTLSKHPFLARMLLFYDCAARRLADNVNLAGYTEVIGWNVASPAQAAEISALTRTYVLSKCKVVTIYRD